MQAYTVKEKLGEKDERERESKGIEIVFERGEKGRKSNDGET